MRPGGRRLIGEDVPLPLYWQQYAHHQHPERNAGSNGVVRVVGTDGESISIECTGTTASGSVWSRFLLTVHRRTEEGAYVFDLWATLQIPDDRVWLVTPNAHHGELEFCNLWPDGAFAGDLRVPLLYQACYLVRGQRVQRIPHHHFESADKHNIALNAGDRLTWLLEQENLCVELLSQDTVTAGVCAYMWDVHLAYKICQDGRDALMAAGTGRTAGFRLTSLLAPEARDLVERAEEHSWEPSGQPPVIVPGIHTFSETPASPTADPAGTWPWETEVVTGDPGTVKFTVDQQTGFDDSASVRIDAPQSAAGMWKATALGPAFRQPPFPDARQYRLTAYLKTQLTEGSAGIAIRLHREGASDLFDTRTYEVYRSGTLGGKSSAWNRLEITTPRIHPRPDRLHILLELNGAGTCWFDNVHLSIDE